MAESNTFRWPVRVYYEDTDAQGVVYYASYFRFMERARTEWIRSLGIEQDSLFETERLQFVVVEARAKFRRPARFNEELTVTVQPVNRTRASFVLRQDIHRLDDSETLLVSGEVRAACVDGDSGRPARLPDSFIEELSL